MEKCGASSQLVCLWTLVHSLSKHTHTNRKLLYDVYKTATINEAQSPCIAQTTAAHGESVRLKRSSGLVLLLMANRYIEYTSFMCFYTIYVLDDGTNARVCNRLGLLFKLLCGAIYMSIWKRTDRRIYNITPCLTSDLFMAYFRHGFVVVQYTHTERIQAKRTPYAPASI